MTLERDVGRIDQSVAALTQRLEERIRRTDSKFEEIDEHLASIASGIAALDAKIDDDREARKREAAYHDGAIRGATWVGGVVIAAASAVGTWVISHFPVVDMIAGLLFKRPPSP